MCCGVELSVCVCGGGGCRPMCGCLPCVAVPCAVVGTVAAPLCYLFIAGPCVHRACARVRMCSCVRALDCVCGCVGCVGQPAARRVVCHDDGAEVLRRVGAAPCGQGGTAVLRARAATKGALRRPEGLPGFARCDCSRAQPRDDPHGYTRSPRTHGANAVTSTRSPHLPCAACVRALQHRTLHVCLMRRSVCVRRGRSVRRVCVGAGGLRQVSHVNHIRTTTVCPPACVVAVQAGTSRT